MHSISLAIVGVLLVTLCPYTTFATTTETAELEEPKILPLQEAKSVNNDPKLGYSELWQEDDREVLIRNERGAKDNNGQATTTTDSCRYTKGAWTECDPKSNTRSRTLTLKKGEGSCVQSRTIQKKCKNKSKPEKACRYEKGTWSECQQPTGDMTRLDKLKATSDSATCAPTRTMNKKCNKSKQDKQNKQRTKEKKQNDRKNRQ